MSQRKHDTLPSFLKNLSSSTSRFMSRPRSSGWFGSSSSGMSQPYSSVGSRSYAPSLGYSSSYTSPSSYKHYNPYTSSGSRSRQSIGHGIYGGTSSGYGGVYLPSSHSTLHSLNLITPTSRNYNRSKNRQYKDYVKSKDPPPVPPARKNRSEQKVLPEVNSNLNKEKSRSLSALVRRDSSRSLASVTSEGYESGTDVDEGTGVGVNHAGDGLDNAADENLDYKALWQASTAEVKVLRAELRDAKSVIETLNQMNQNPMSEIEKREKRAMERKLSEMEEELKALQLENKKLADENSALIRVVAKLSK